MHLAFGASAWQLEGVSPTPEHRSSRQLYKNKATFVPFQVNRVRTPVFRPL